MAHVYCSGAIKNGNNDSEIEVILSPNLGSKRAVKICFILNAAPKSVMEYFRLDKPS